MAVRMKVVLDAERGTEGPDEEGPGADVDGAEHSDQAEKVQPGRHPSSAPVAENGTPVIEPTRRRIGRADLRHRHGENETDEASDQPAHPDRDTAGARSALGERVDAARQDADDREGYCEVGETAWERFRFGRATRN